MSNMFFECILLLIMHIRASLYYVDIKDHKKQEL